MIETLSSTATRPGEAGGGNVRLRDDVVIGIELNKVRNSTRSTDCQWSRRVLAAVMAIAVWTMLRQVELDGVRSGQPKVLGWTVRRCSSR